MSTPGAEGAALPVGRRRRAIVADRPVLRYAFGRLAGGVGLIFGISLITFLATNVLPGDPAATILGRYATPEAIAALHQELGLDRPVWIRYVDWLQGMLTGNLGTSYASQQPIVETLVPQLVNSLVLAVLGMALVLAIAFPLGIVSGIHRGKAIDHVISVVGMILVAIPGFVIATLLALALGIKLAIFPAVSYFSAGTGPLDNLSKLVLPAIAIACLGAPYLVRLIRSSVAEVLSTEFVECARLQGVAESRVVLRYVLPNSLPPTVQMIATTIQWLVAGAFFVEVIFAYPGMGLGLVNAVVARDLPDVATRTFIIAAMVVVINVLADLIVVLLIPKLRTAH